MSHGVLVSGLHIDRERATSEIVTFIQKTVTEASARGVVIGLSGGVDSSLVAALSVRAVGSENVLGLIMPAEFTPSEDTLDARELSKILSIRNEVVPIQNIVSSITWAVKCDSKDLSTKIPIANLHSRSRMIILYYFANLHNYLVAGTGDRSEDLIGYFTKYGDGGVDFLPISHLYKTQVRELAKYVGVPSKIAAKPSSPQLYPGHKATDEIPIDYHILDGIEKMLFDDELSPQRVAEKTGLDPEIIKQVVKRYKLSHHKRTYPKMVKDW